jgi:hypothetical protein
MEAGKVVTGRVRAEEPSAGVGEQFHGLCLPGTRWQQ